MLYAQFYQKSAISNELIEACGDRSVIILDGRYSNASNGIIAKEECKKRGYLAWSIHKGESFTRSVKVSGLWYVDYSKVDTTANSASYGM